MISRISSADACSSARRNESLTGKKKAFCTGAVKSDDFGHGFESVVDFDNNKKSKQKKVKKVITPGQNPRLYSGTFSSAESTAIRQQFKKEIKKTKKSYLTSDRKDPSVYAHAYQREKQRTTQVNKKNDFDLTISNYKLAERKDGPLKKTQSYDISEIKETSTTENTNKNSNLTPYESYRTHTNLARNTSKSVLSGNETARQTHFGNINSITNNSKKEPQKPFTSRAKTKKIPLYIKLQPPPKSDPNNVIKNAFIMSEPVIKDADVGKKRPVSAKKQDVQNENADLSAKTNNKPKVEILLPDKENDEVLSKTEVFLEEETTNEKGDININPPKTITSTYSEEFKPIFVNQRPPLSNIPSGAVPVSFVFFSKMMLSIQNAVNCMQNRLNMKICKIQQKIADLEFVVAALQQK